MTTIEDSYIWKSVAQARCKKRHRQKRSGRFVVQGTGYSFLNGIRRVGCLVSDPFISFHNFISYKI